MNAKHPHLRVTFELENQHTFSILDVKIIRNTQKKYLKIQPKSRVHSVISLKPLKVLSV